MVRTSAKIFHIKDALALTTPEERSEYSGLLLSVRVPNQCKLACIYSDGVVVAPGQVLENTLRATGAPQILTSLIVGVPLVVATLVGWCHMIFPPPLFLLCVAMYRCFDDLLCPSFLFSLSHSFLAHVSV